MQRLSLITITAAGLLALAACAPEASPPGESAEDSCGASGQQHLVGQSWPQPLPPGMTRVRVVREGEPMTMDFHADRVNVTLTRDGREIQAIWCG